MIVLCSVSFREQWKIYIAAVVVVVKIYCYVMMDTDVQLLSESWFLGRLSSKVAIQWTVDYTVHTLFVETEWRIYASVSQEIVSDKELSTLLRQANICNFMAYVIVNLSQRNMWNMNTNSTISIQRYEVKNVGCKMAAISSWVCNWIFSFQFLCPR